MKKVIVLILLSFAVFVVIFSVQAQHRGMGMCWDDNSNQWGSNWSNLFDSAIDPKALPEPKSKGAKKYNQFCSQCHALQSPKAKSAKEWVGLVSRMDMRMQHMESMSQRWMMHRNINAMSSEDKKIIITYLQKHSFKTFDADKSKINKKSGLKQFKANCSTCHALPSPKQHSSKEWPKVIEKMKKYVAAQNRPPINKKDERSILKFLQANSSHE